MYCIFICLYLPVLRQINLIAEVAVYLAIAHSIKPYSLFGRAFFSSGFKFALKILNYMNQICSEKVFEDGEIPLSHLYFVLNYPFKIVMEPAIKYSFCRNTSSLYFDTFSQLFRSSLDFTCYENTSEDKDAGIGPKA